MKTKLNDGTYIVVDVKNKFSMHSIPSSINLCDREERIY